LAGRSAIRWWLLALAMAMWPSPRTAAQEVLRLDTRQPNPSKPIRLSADSIVTSSTGDWQYFRMHGTVLIEQGITRVRGQRAVVRYPREPLRREGMYQLELYVEAEVQLEHASMRRAVERAFIAMSTKGEVDLSSKSNQIAEESLKDDALVARANEVFGLKLDSAVKPAAGQVPDGNGPMLPAPPVPSIDTIPGGLPNFSTVPPTQQPKLMPNPLPGPPRVLRLGPRYGRLFEIDTNLEQRAIVVSGGVILHISNVDRIGLIDIEADNAVIWTKDNPQQFFQNMQSASGESSRESEFFLSGNVVIRALVNNEERTLRAEQVYYDVNRNVAVAIAAHVEFRQRGFVEALHFKADEVFQINATEFKAVRAEVFSSRLPSDPGLRIVLAEASLSQRRVPRTNLFGIRFIDRETGEPQEVTERTFRGENVTVRLGPVPIFFLPYIQGRITDPAGPLKSINIRNDGIFGFQVLTEFDVHHLLGVIPPPGTNWSLTADYLSRRGPVLGTFYEYRGAGLTNVSTRHAGAARILGIYDEGTDILGGGRGGAHPTWRGRASWRHDEEFGDGWRFQGQVSLLSDKNFFEQYFKPEFDLGQNQETFGYLTLRRPVWGGSILAETKLRSWMTEVEWLPKADGYLSGWTFFDRFTYNAHGSIGYAQSKPTTVPPPALLPTEAAVNTGRFNLWQDISMPLNAGPWKVVPFGVIDLSAYTADLAGNYRGRFYGGGGIRASLPLSRLYAEAYSDLFNVQGIYHKIQFSGTYYNAWSSIAHTALPQLDRLNDDATDQALRDITPLQPILNPANGVALATSPLFNPQRYAIRRLVDTRPDTLDSIHVFQLDLRQRWQTKRGFPGLQHTVDWLTLDLSATLFPNASRDNFGNAIGFIEYDAVWNVGDRTAVVSSGWVDPFDVGARYFTFGSFLNRPDRTSFYLGYRHTDPIDSRLLSFAASYVFSPKYSIAAASSFDFGNNRGLSHALTLTRSGTDLQLNLSVSYNPIQNNFGFNVELLPNIAAARRGGSSLAGQGLFGSPRGF